MSALRKILWCGATLVFAWEQRAAAVENLTWSNGVQEASRNNGELRAASAQKDSVEQSVNSSQSGYYPQVATSVGYSYSGVLPVRQSVLEGNSSREDRGYTAGLSVSQEIFAGGRTRAAVNQSKASLRAAEAEVLIVKSRVSRDLKAAFANMLFAQRSVEMQAEISRRRQENLRLVTLRFESGAENKGSVLLSQAYLDQSKLEALQARHGLEVAQAQLAQVLGRDRVTDLRVSDDVPIQVPPSAPDFNGLVQQNPLHRQSLSKVEEATASVAVARAGYYPTLRFSGNLGRTGQDWFPDRENWTLGLSLEYPLFDGFRDRSAVYAAAATLNATEYTRSQGDRDLMAQLQSAYSTWLEAIEKVNVESSFYKASQLRAEIARNKYNNGLLTFEEWDLIESDLIARENSILQSKRDRVIAEANWEQTQGKGVIR